jgi:hypothetical protein
MLFIQMVTAIIGSKSTSSFLLTLVLSVLPVILGILVLKKLIIKDDPWTRKDSLFFILMGILGLILWAGLLVGPSIVIILSLLPNYGVK